VFVCHCEAVTDRTVTAAISSGARTVEELTDRCRAGGGCGSCHSHLEALIEASLSAMEPLVAVSAA
jgi:bacterioferritin-associated ferredoxin